MEDLIKVSVDKVKVKSILKMAELSLEMTTTINESKFPSNLTKEYYEIIRETISCVLLLDGYKAYGEGAHKISIEYLAKNYKEFSSYEISIIEELRIIRNKIAYDGFFVQVDFIKSKKEIIEKTINKLMKLVKSRL